MRNYSKSDKRYAYGPGGSVKPMPVPDTSGPFADGVSQKEILKGAEAGMAGKEMSTSDANKSNVEAIETGVMTNRRGQDAVDTGGEDT